MEAVIRVKVWLSNHWVKKHIAQGLWSELKPVNVCYHTQKNLEVTRIFGVFKKSAGNFLFAVENLVIPGFYQAASGLHSQGTFLCAFLF